MKLGFYRAESWAQLLYDLDWFCGLVQKPMETVRPAIIVDDLTWRSAYDVLIANGRHQLLRAAPTVLSGGRLLKTSGVPTEGDLHRAAAIPYP